MEKSMTNISNMSNFESFSEDLVPRVVPMPVLLPSQDISRPTVPEVSLIFDKPTTRTQMPQEDARPMTYKEWRQQQFPLNAPHSVVQNACDPTANSFSTLNKKNVRFDKLPETYATSNVKQVENDMNAVQLSEKNASAPLNDFSVSVFDNNFRMSTQSPPIDVTSKNKNKFIDSKITQRNINVPVLNTVQKSYTDHQQQNKEVTIDDLYNLLLLQQLQNNEKQLMQTEVQTDKNTDLCQASQVSNGIGESCNSSSNKTCQGELKPVHACRCSAVQELPQRTDQCGASSNCSSSGALVDAPKNTEISDEPTMKDLFKVIVKQQEQLIRLQEQVQTLLLRENNRTLVDASSIKGWESKHLHALCNANDHEKSKAVGVMTSLEINIQQKGDLSNSIKNHLPQHEQNPSLEHDCQCCCMSKNIQQCDAIKDLTIPPPIGNVDGNGKANINKNSTPGWTFYGNILEQVNDVLQNSQPPNAATLIQTQHVHDGYNLGNLHPNINTAEFQQIGFQCDDVNISTTTKKVTFDTKMKDLQSSNQKRNTNLRINCSERSMMMNALAIKYLPNDDLHRIAPNSNIVTQQPVNSKFAPELAAQKIYSGEEVRSPTNLSLASYRYMEKYGLFN